MKNINEVQKLYAGRASFYDRLFVDFLGWGKQLEAFFRRSDYVQPNAKILDAGCGTGIITRVLYQVARERKYDGIQFHAFDLTQAMLDVFQQWITRLEANTIELAQADVLALETLPSHWNGYTLIVSSTMLEYLPRHKVKDALLNLKRLLSKDGTLLIFLTRRNPMTRLLAGALWKTNLYTEAEIQAVLHDAGFQDIKFNTFSPVWSNYIMVIQAHP